MGVVRGTLESSSTGRSLALPHHQWLPAPPTVRLNTPAAVKEANRGDITMTCTSCKYHMVFVFYLDCDITRSKCPIVTKEYKKIFIFVEY